MSRERRFDYDKGPSLEEGETIENDGENGETDGDVEDTGPSNSNEIRRPSVAVDPTGSSPQMGSALYRRQRVNKLKN
ncbi:hypothetical protein [Natrinema sp. 74]|uniref:hypothetical protein n=1 Tax=Natrinema sp. 74 TaxID=3384159 RepID=UPI0038D39A60